jgi:hypothetical protein
MKDCRIASELPDADAGFGSPLGSMPASSYLDEVDLQIVHAADPAASPWQQLGRALGLERDGLASVHVAVNADVDQERGCRSREGGTDPRTTASTEPQVDDRIARRRLRGSNPRGSCPPTRFPGVCLRPLGQASAAQSTPGSGGLERPLPGPYRRVAPGAPVPGGRSTSLGRNAPADVVCASTPGIEQHRGLQRDARGCGRRRRQRGTPSERCSRNDCQNG